MFRPLCNGSFGTGENRDVNAWVYTFDIVDFLKAVKIEIFCLIFARIESLPLSTRVKACIFFFFRRLERILAGRLYNLITRIESVINNNMLNVFKHY